MNHSSVFAQDFWALIFTIHIVHASTVGGIMVNSLPGPFSYKYTYLKDCVIDFSVLWYWGQCMGRHLLLTISLWYTHTSCPSQPRGSQQWTGTECTPGACLLCQGQVRRPGIFWVSRSIVGVGAMTSWNPVINEIVLSIRGKFLTPCKYLYNNSGWLVPRWGHAMLCSTTSHSNGILTLHPDCHVSSPGDQLVLNKSPLNVGLNISLWKSAFRILTADFHNVLLSSALWTK